MDKKIKLRDLITIARGVTYKSALLDQPGPILLGLGTIRRHGGFRSSSLRMYGGESPSAILVQPGQLYASLKDVTQTADVLGAVARLPHDGPVGRLTQDTVRLDIKDSAVSTEYLYWMLRTPQYRAYCRAHATGTTTMGLSREDFFNYAIPAPSSQSLALVKLLGALDDKIAANERLARTSMELARTIYQDAVAHAPARPMSSVLEPVLGGTPRRSDASHWDGTVPWLSAKDIAEARHGIVIATSEGISAVAASVRRLRPLPKGSVVLTARGTVGKVARLALDASINQSCYGFVPGLIPPACLMFVVEAVTTQAKSMAHGSVFDTITMRTFDHVTIPDLDRDDWATIEARVGSIVAIGQQVAIESSRLARARDDLIPLLMAGKLCVKSGAIVDAAPGQRGSEQ